MQLELSDQLAFIFAASIKKHWRPSRSVAGWMRRSMVVRAHVRDACAMNELPVGLALGFRV